MTLGELRDITDDLSDDMKLYIFSNNVLIPISIESSSIFDLKDDMEIVESILVLSTSRNDGEKDIVGDMSLINLN